MFRKADPLIPRPKRPRWKRVAMALACAYLVVAATQAAMIEVMIHRTIEPELWAKLSVVEAPIKVQPQTASDTTRFSVGYASFELPHDTQIKMHAPAYVHAEAGTISVQLAPPMEADSSDETLTQFEALSQGIWSRLKHWASPSGGSDPHQVRSIVDIYWDNIDVAPRSFWRLSWNMGDSVAYTIRLLMKSLYLHGKVERLLRFEGPDTVGVIFVNEGGASGGVTLSSRDRKVSQVMTFKLHPKPDEFPGNELSAFLASYRFNVDGPMTEDEAAAMIVKAGVSPSADTAVSPPANAPHDCEPKD